MPSLPTLPFARKCTAATLALAAAMTTAWSPVHADPAPFELTGPQLRVEVTRGGVTLPIAQVPSLSPGDRIAVHGAMPHDQDVKFLLVSAFLRGATNPPPDDWIETARTWKDKEKDKALALTVPEGARQLVLMLVPETGGAQGVLSDAVQGKPGEFVRASQDLNQASLDHSRLLAFMAAIRAQDDSGPEYLRSVAPVLAHSLSIKLQEDCLSRVIEQQASCLIENRDTLVLRDVHSSSLADTLIGAPTDLALQLSATREAGAGYYSPYIAVARDVARIFGAFNNPQFDYLPTLTVRDGDALNLLLNAAPSFQKPKSVMVAALPAIEADIPPQLRSTAKGPICMAGAATVLPVEGAPLVFSTDFAHDVKVRLTAPGGQSVDVPVTARADRGGYVLDAQGLSSAFTGSVRAHLHGRWGFAPFDGPDFILQRAGDGGLAVAGEGAVAGRENLVVVKGGAPACVESVMLEAAGEGSGSAAPQRLNWSMRGEQGLAVTVPLDPSSAAERRLSVRYRGRSEPVSVPLAVSPAARGPQARLLNRTIYPGAPEAGGRALDLGGGDLLPDTGEVVFSIAAGAPLRPGYAVEVATRDGEPAARLTAGKGLTPENDKVLVATLEAADLPPGTFGPLRFRLVQKDDAPGARAGDWQPLATLVRLPVIEGVDCPAKAGQAPPTSASPTPSSPTPAASGVPGGGCTLTGRKLFLLDAVGTDPALAAPQAVPTGYTGRRLQVPGAGGRTLYLRLRDAPDSVIALKPQ